jgi:hypothetical protein
MVSRFVQTSHFAIGMDIRQLGNHAGTVDQPILDSSR